MRSSLRWIAASLVVAGGAMLLFTGGSARTSRLAKPAPSATERVAAPSSKLAPSKRAAANAPAKPRRAEAATHATTVRASWGSEVGELGKHARSEGDGEAPMAFAVDARGRAHVLDQVNSRIQVFDEGAVVSVLELPADSFQDLVVDAKGREIVLDRLATETVAFFDELGRLDHTVPIVGQGVPEGGAVTGLFTREDGTYVEVEHTSLVRVALANGDPDPARRQVPGRMGHNGHAATRAALAGPNAVRVTREPLDPSATGFVATADFPLAILGVHALEQDREGRTFLAVNLIRESERAPFAILEDREVLVVLDADGREERRVELEPPDGALEQFSPIRVGDDGQVYELVARKDGATIERYAR